MRPNCRYPNSDFGLLGCPGFEESCPSTSKLLKLHSFPVRALGKKPGQRSQKLNTQAATCTSTPPNMYLHSRACGLYYRVFGCIKICWGVLLGSYYASSCRHSILGAWDPTTRQGRVHQTGRMVRASVTPSLEY